MNFAGACKASGGPTHTERSVPSARPAPDAMNRRSAVGGGSIQARLRCAQECEVLTVFKAHRLVYHSTLGLRVIMKKKYGSHQLLREKLGGVVARG